MSDNLQQVYLRRLKSANEAALHGNLQECLDICSELRLKPDLTLYTRALVNLTLADACPIEDHPDKMKFAREALRLATELHDSPDQTEDAVWRERLKLRRTPAQDYLKPTDVLTGAVSRRGRKRPSRREQRGRARRQRAVSRQRQGRAQCTVSRGA